MLGIKTGEFLAIFLSLIIYGILRTNLEKQNEKN